ncbi:MAG: CHRD domain-containing protein, partial [Cyclobacteriaceae bacterium]
MKNVIQKFLMVAAIASVVFYFSGCDDESDPAPQLTGDSHSYPLASVSDPAISGNVTFAQRDDDKVLVTIQLTGTQATASHPAHIHANSAAAGGGIVLDLSPVSGADGKSETVVDALNDGTPMTYEGLLDFNGFVNVHASESDLATLIAQGDIGGNELTGDTKVYTPSPVADPAIAGTLTIAKRKRGTSLVTVALTGTPAGSYNSHFHSNAVAKGGPITINLKPVDGTTGMAITSVDTLNNGNAITYDELLNYNGHFNVHGLGSYLVQADIGGNELTGDTKVYTPSPVADPSIGGTLTIAKRKRGTSLVTVALTGTPAGTYNSHFHSRTVASGGPITINLKPVNGTTGMAITSVDTLNNGDAITYDELLNYNGHFNVHG